MNKENKQRFTELYMKTTLEKYPSFKEKLGCVPPPKLKEAGANDLTRLVIDFLEMNGCQAERISTTGMYRDTKKQVTDCIGRVRTIGSGIWTPGSGTKGSADISATIKGRSVKIEIKWQKDRQSEAQKSYEEQIMKAGGIYIIVKTFDDFVNWYDDFESTFLF